MSKNLGTCSAMLSHWHPKSEPCLAPILCFVVVWLSVTANGQMNHLVLVHPRGTFPCNCNFNAPSQNSWSIHFYFILHGQPFDSFLFKHCQWIFNSIFFCKYCIYILISRFLSSGLHTNCSFLSWVSKYIPISINIILQNLWVMYIFVCYTFFIHEQNHICSSDISLL
jgi:hypothetical protein